MIPLIGFPSSDMTATLPFFAAPRIDATTYPTTYQTDTANVQQIPSPLAPTPPTGAVVCSTFGCYLDINQPTPQFPLNPSTASTPSGPWSASELKPIPAIIMSDHACLVAEIAYDPDPIPSGANAENSDKLGQRNLNWAPSGNPGDPATHRIPALFDIKPSTVKAPSRLNPPDELMIEWGATPVGSKAAIYMPQVSASGIIALADKLYVTHSLRAEGASTIACTTGAITYVPIPAGSGQNFAGLLTLDLPATVRKGQQFEVVVRRVTSFRPALFNAQDEERQPVNWRYVVGAFQLNIPVSTAAKLLGPEENLLAVFKWKLEQLPATNRWLPVLRRYVDLISARVDGFGGSGLSDPALAQRLSWNRPERRRRRGGGGPKGLDVEFVGKVAGLIYDRFGDFEGFTLETEHGAFERFHCVEQAIEELVRRAWIDRYVIAVIARKGERHIPVSIILRRAPRE